MGQSSKLEQLPVQSDPPGWRQLLRHRWRWLAGVVLFCLVNGLIGYYLLRDWRTLSFSSIRLNPTMLALCWLVQLGSMSLALTTWVLMLRQLGYRIPYRQHIKNYTLSNLASHIPGFIWGVVGRAYMYERSGGGRLDISAAALIEMLLAGLSGALVALLALALPGGTSAGWNPITLVAALALAAALLHPALAGRASRSLQQRYPGRKIMALRWYHLPFWTLLNTLTTLLGGCSLFFFCLALFPGDDRLLVPALQGWGLAVASGTLLFWLPAEISITSGVLVLLLSAAMPLPQALVIALAWRLWNTLYHVQLGLLGLVL